MNGTIKKISGPLIIAKNMQGADMFDVVYAGDKELTGEIIEMHGDEASIQVYEETSGIKPGEKVTTLHYPLSVELAPGLIGNIFDGIQRPLYALQSLSGDRLERGVHTNAIDKSKKWDFVPCIKNGEYVSFGDILGEVKETDAVIHKIMVPYGFEGKVSDLRKGSFTVEEDIAKISGKGVCMLQRWPVRKGRPYKDKMPPSVPLPTGQRVIDTFFPIAKGGVATVPGPFGSGKTVVQHQLAKWCDADIVVYIGCGERGNEMTDVLNEFPEIKDPKTGKTLMERTVLIANTSDMPVAAREASIYTGVTIAEYFRDMGYSVVLLADSTSRWAEALREMSGRLEEMPGEEGYPAYLGSRLAGFYERAGQVITNGRDNREGSLTMIGAVSPPGGDISEPVAQATLRIVKVFWGLDSALAYKRHFPAINWLTSYSLYIDRLENWFSENVNKDFNHCRNKLITILQEESKLEEIVRLVGIDALSNSDRLKMEIARIVREDFLHQNAFHEIDTYTSYTKQLLMMKIIIFYYESAHKALERGISISQATGIKSKEQIGRLKYVKESEIENSYKKLKEDIQRETEALTAEENSGIFADNI